MKQMNSYAFVAALAACAFLSLANTAMADLEVHLTADKLHLDYIAGAESGHMTIMTQVVGADAGMSQVTAYLNNAATNTQPDFTYLNSTNENTFVMDMALERVMGVWTATGTWTVRDKNREVLKANFTSTTLETVADGNLQFNANPAFVMTGILTPFAGTAVLEGSTGAPWTFVGTANKGGIGNGSDGIAKQISLSGWENYKSGTIVTTHFLLGNYQATNEWLGTSHTGDNALDGGWASATVVPVPAATVLGLMGLGLLGWRMRKYA